jgi:hypothetical protein
MPYGGGSSGGGGTVNLASGVTGTLAIGNGGTSGATQAAAIAALGGALATYGNKADSFTVSLSDRGKLFNVFLSHGDDAVTMPSAVTAGAGFTVFIVRSDDDDTAALTVDSNRVVYSREFAVVWSDGSSWNLYKFFDAQRGKARDANGDITLDFANRQAWFDGNVTFDWGGMYMMDNQGNASADFTSHTLSAGGYNKLNWELGVAFSSDGLYQLSWDIGRLEGTAGGAGWTAASRGLQSDVFAIESAESVEDVEEIVRKVTRQNAVRTTDDTITTLFSYDVSEGQTFGLSGVITARRTGGASGTDGDGAMFEVKCALRNDAGTVTPIGSETITVVGRSEETWEVTISYSTGVATINVQGPDANDILWHWTGDSYATLE